MIIFNNRCQGYKKLRLMAVLVMQTRYFKVIKVWCSWVININNVHKEG